MIATVPFLFYYLNYPPPNPGFKKQTHKWIDLSELFLGLLLQMKMFIFDFFLISKKHPLSMA